jgi:phosphoribosylformylglycinamidine cyclo-ligase
MPGFYSDGEYDIAGFIVGVVERRSIVDGRRIAPGDALIGLSSSGLHTNGYSLARRVLFDGAKLAPAAHSPALGQSVGDALLATHRSYARAVRPVLDAGLIKGMAHITGGGITENLPRVLPEGCGAVVSRASWTIPPLFTLIQELGSVSTPEMFRTFNMGIGLILVCGASDRERVQELLLLAGEKGAAVLGEVEAGDRVVRYQP